MFAKLKKKVEDLEGSDLHKLANSLSSSSNSLAEKTLSLVSLRSNDNLSAAVVEPSLAVEPSSAVEPSLAEEPSSSSASIATPKSDDTELAKKIEKEWQQKMVDFENEWKVKVIIQEHEKKELIKERETMNQHLKKIESQLNDLKGYQEKYLEVQSQLQKLYDTQKNLESQLLGYDTLKEDVQIKDEKIKTLEKQLLLNKETAINLAPIMEATTDITTQTVFEEIQLQEPEEKELEVKDTLQKLNEELNSVMDQLNEEKKFNEILQKKFEILSDEKNNFLVRNADLSQQTSLCQQQLQRTEKELGEMTQKSHLFQEENKQFKLLLSEAQAVNVNPDNSELQSQLTEKNKTIKLLQQRLSDMKKTLQKELKNQTNSESDLSSMHLSSNLPAPPATLTSDPGNSDLDEVNFRYLKHVIFKFLTSREYEVNSNQVHSLLLINNL